MDELDEETLNALRDGKPHTFNQLLEKITFSHNTLTLHLDKLVDLKLILKEKIPRETRGRPIYVYSVSSVGRKASLMLRSGVRMWLLFLSAILGRFVSLRGVVSVRGCGWSVKPGFVPKSVNGFNNHF